MTLQASSIGLDALLAAARVLVFQFGALGEIDARALGPQERSGELGGGVALIVPTGGSGPGTLGLTVGMDAAATVVGEGDVLERWEPLMAQVVIALSASAGDLQPENLQLLPSGAGNGPAVDPEAISVGFFLDDQLLAVLGFVAESAAEQVPAPALVSAPAPALVSAPARAPAPAPARASVSAPVPVSQIFQPLAGGEPARVQDRRIALLNDVEMGVSVELGRTRMTVRELLALAPSVIVELNKPAGAPVDLLVNGTLMARGEVVVVDEEFAIRISEIVTPELIERRGSSERRGA